MANWNETMNLQQERTGDDRHKEAIVGYDGAVYGSAECPRGAPVVAVHVLAGKNRTAEAPDAADGCRVHNPAPSFLHLLHAWQVGSCRQWASITLMGARSEGM